MVLPQALTLSAYVTLEPWTPYVFESLMAALVQRKRLTSFDASKLFLLFLFQSIGRLIVPAWSWDVAQASPDPEVDRDNCKATGDLGLA